MSKKSSSVLQKKLQDLESQLKIAFSLSPHEGTSTYQLCSQYFDSRFDFLRKLVSAEIASSSRPKKPFYLQKVAQSLTELETKFREWESSCTSKPLTALDDHNVEQVSTCSCAESSVNDDKKYYEGLAEEKVDAHNIEEEEVEEWLNDDEDEEEGDGELESAGFEEAKKFLEQVRGEHEEVNNSLKEEVGGGSESEKEMNRSLYLWVGKFVNGAMAAGLVLGMALMGSFMVGFSGCGFHYVKHDSFLPPPT